MPLMTDHCTGFAIYYNAFRNQDIMNGHARCSPYPKPLIRFMQPKMSQWGRRSSEIEDDPAIEEIPGMKYIPKWCRNSWPYFIENTTFHGLRDCLLSDSYFSQFLWSIVLFVSITLSIHGCYMIIAEYLERPVVVSYFVAGMNEMRLPDITICPFNRFNLSYLEEHNITGTLAQHLEMAYPSVPFLPFQFDMVGPIIDEATKNDIILKEILKKKNLTFREFLYEAAIDCTAFFVDKSICENVTEIMTSVGKCFRVPGHTQENDGYGYGYRIVITLPKHLYHPGLNQMLNDGVGVKLAEKIQGSDHDLTFIPAGVHAILPLSATFYDFINDPPRYACLEKPHDHYGALWCFEYCYVGPPEEACNCSTITSIKPRQPNVCLPGEMFDCFYKHLNDKNNTDRLNECKSSCEAPCQYWKYSKTLSTARLSKSLGARLTHKDVTDELENTIILEVFFTTLDYTIIKHVLAMTPSSFIAQIGGQISLWIGGSIVSVIQLLVYVTGTGYAAIVRKIFGIDKTLNNNRRQTEEDIAMRPVYC
uniref:Acid-sensing ion channel 1 n=1 Tax=Panagrellus redivivus TaxID=6233 RepID=A0A7E4ZVR6_PANRE